MSENGENIESSGLDGQLSGMGSIKEPQVEKYQNSGKEGQVVSDQHIPLPQGEPSKLTKWTIREIERVLSQTTLKPPRERVEQFTAAQHLKSNFKMKSFARTMDLSFRRDHKSEMTTGPVENRVRDFDIKSQMMRSITANAAMGSYQFQKNMVLPYMRKDLALGYQKVAILKEISGGISNMEKAIVSKLEAIKINTAAAVPRKQGYFKKLGEDIAFLNRRRIAQNISNYTVDGYERLYNKYATPRLQQLNERINDSSASGGVNAVRRSVSGKLTKVLRSVRAVSDADTSDMSTMGKVKVRGAKVANRVLGTTFKGLQKIRFGKERNNAISDLLKGPTEDLAKFNPFAQPGQSAFDPEGEELVPQRKRGSGNSNGASSNKLLAAFNEWRKEYRKDQDTSLDKLSQLSDVLACCCEDAGGKLKRKPARKRSRPSISQVKSSDVLLEPETMDLETEVSVKDNPVPEKKRSFFSKISSLLSPSRKDKTTVAVSGDNNTPSTPKSLSIEPTVNSKILSNDLTVERSLSRSQGSMIPLISRDSSEPATDISPNKSPMSSPLTSAVNLLGLKQSTSNLQRDAEKDRQFIKQMFDNLGEKVTGVTQSVQEGNEKRTWFEKIQLQWKETSERMMNQKTRKNSYEDLQAQKADKKKGILSGFGNRAKLAAVGVGGNLAQGQIADAALAAGGQAFEWGKEILSDTVGEQVSDLTDKAKEKAKEKTSRAWRKAKLMRTSRGRRLARSVGSNVASSAGTTLLNNVATPVAKKGLIRKSAGFLGKGALSLAGGAASLGLKGAGYAGKMGLRGAGKAAGYLGKGAFKIAKGVGPGLVAGLAADAAGDWIGENTTGATRRIGKTAATAASWAATGAGIGSIVPVLGTGLGAAVGGGLGAIYENTDLIRSGLAYATNKAFDGLEAVGKAGSWTWKNLFGKDPEFDKKGKVVEKETPSLMGHISSLFFGRDAKYSKSGDLILSGKEGVVSDLRRGFDLFFFGIKDPKDKDKFKPGSSMLSKLTTSFFGVISSFEKTMADLPKTILDSLKGIGRGIASGAENLVDNVTNGYDTLVNGATNYWGSSPGSTGEKDIYDGKGTPVPDAAAIARNLIPNIVITSQRRPAGRAGNAGNGSWHVKSGAAIDVAPVPNMTFGQFKKTFEDAGYSLIEAIDETKPETMKKTGATGPHWHIVLGNKTNVASSPYSMTPKAPVIAPKGKGAFVMQTGKDNKYAWSDTLNPTNKAGNPTAPGYATGVGAGSAVPGGKSETERFRSSVNYLTKKGYSKTAAMGIAANLYSESGLKTTAFNSEGGGQGAKGIAQWRGPRITDIESKWGKSINEMTLSEQLDAVDNELREGKHVTSSKAIPYGTSPIVETINRAPNVEAVVQQLVHRFERPAGSVYGLEEHTNKRIATARGLIEKMGGMGSNTPTPPKPNVVANPVTEAQKQAAAKPKTPPAPKPKPPTPSSKPTPSKHEDGLFATMNDTLSKIGNYFTGDDKKKDAGKGNTVVAPISVTTNNSNFGNNTPTTMSMLKTSVRTGM